MRNEAMFSSMSFAIAGLQVACGIDGEQLKIKITPADSLKPIHLAICKLAADPSSIELSIAQLLPSPASNPSSNPLSTRNQQSINSKLQEKLSSLENSVKLLEEKLLLKSQSRRDLKKSSSSEGRFGNNNSRSNLGVLPSMAIRENEEVQYAEIIQEEVSQNAKLQLLNDLLQQKILEKESVCLEVEKRLLEREELIRELADKLIVANIEKEDIFNEYEKILQNNVFHRMEEVPAKHHESSKQEQAQKYETVIEEATTSGPQSNSKLEISEPTRNENQDEEQRKEDGIGCG